MHHRVGPLIWAMESGQLSDRLQGGNGPDTEGLLAAILIVTVLYGMVPRSPWDRGALVGLGCLAGLVAVVGFDCCSRFGARICPSTSPGGT